MDYVKNQEMWLKAYNIKKGSKVRITRKADNYEDGWENTWVKDMDGFVGKVGIVVDGSNSTCARGIRVAIDSFHAAFIYPYFVLEPVKED